MSIVYPGALDNFTNPVAGDTMAAVPHDQQHSDENDAIEALEAKVGITGSLDPTSLTYQINAITSAFTGSSSGINTGDQNLFSSVAVTGQSSIIATGTTSTLTMIGSGVTITTDTGTGALIFSATPFAGVALTGHATGSGTSTISVAIRTGVTEAVQLLSDNTTANVTTGRHGYAPKLPNSTGVYLDGQGNYTAPPGGGSADVALTGNVSGSGTTTVSVTINTGVVTEAMQLLADNTTYNVTTGRHGYAPKLPNSSTQYLDGTGAFATPTVSLTGVLNGSGFPVISASFLNPTVFNNTVSILGTTTFNGVVTFSAGVYVTLSSGADGTMWGQTTFQKQSWWANAPVVQPASSGQSSLSAFVSGTVGVSTVAKMQEIHSLLTSVRNALVQVGLIKGSA